MIHRINKDTILKPSIGISGRYEFKHFDKNNNIIWHNIVDNAISREGRRLTLLVMFRGTDEPATFFLRMYNDTPVDTDSLADLTNEASGNGYAPTEITRDGSGWPLEENVSSLVRRLTSEEITFTATGGSWGPVTNVVLATTTDDSGWLVGWAALGASRTLKDGENLKITYAITLTST